MVIFFFFSSRRRHTRYWRDWSSDVCSSDLIAAENGLKDAIGANNGYTRMSITDSTVLEAWKACGLTDWYLATVNSSGVCKISIQMGYIHFNSNSNFNTGIILPPIEGTQNNSETVNATLS